MMGPIQQVIHKDRHNTGQRIILTCGLTPLPPSNQDENDRLYGLIYQSPRLQGFPFSYPILFVDSSIYLSYHRKVGAIKNVYILID